MPSDESALFRDVQHGAPSALSRDVAATSSARGNARSLLAYETEFGGFSLRSSRSLSVPD
jgi:hypothetical protein